VSRSMRPVIQRWGPGIQYGIDGSNASKAIMLLAFERIDCTVSESIIEGDIRLIIDEPKRFLNYLKTMNVKKEAAWLIDSGSLSPDIEGEDVQVLLENLQCIAETWKHYLDDEQLVLYLDA
jgi:hypothetical protein